MGAYIVIYGNGGIKVPLSLRGWQSQLPPCHCESRFIGTKQSRRGQWDCHASLAMTSPRRCEADEVSRSNLGGGKSIA
jgi:hypothetical protein